MAAEPSSPSRVPESGPHDPPDHWLEGLQFLLCPLCAQSRQPVEAVTWSPKIDRVSFLPATRKPPCPLQPEEDRIEGSGGEFREPSDVCSRQLVAWVAKEGSQHFQRLGGHSRLSH